MPSAMQSPMSSQDAHQVLFSRYEDGARPVTFLSDGWELQGVPGTPAQRFSTAKGLLVALTGHPEGRHWSLERYFRLGPKHGHPMPSATRLVADIYDLWPVADDSAPPPLLLTTPGISIPAEKHSLHGESDSFALRESKTDSFRSESDSFALRESKTDSFRSESDSFALRESKTIRRDRPAQKIGIDLDRRAHEVRKLLFAGFGRRMYVCGYDPEDVLQEVYKGLLIRNSGKCPWDPAKSSFGHYVHMVCSCILSNYHRKQHRVREMEQVGLLNPLGSEGEGTRYTDVASSTTVASRSMLVQEDCLMLEEAQDLLVQMQSNGTQDAESRLAARVLPLLLAGTPRDSMATSLGVSAASLSRAMSHLRKQATAWAATQP